MGETTIKTITCDAPRHKDPEASQTEKFINPEQPYINAMTYGACFHIECYKKMTAHELLKALGLDEVKWMPSEDDWPGAEKLCYKKMF